MKKSIFATTLLAAMPLSSFAVETKGIEGLKQYDCTVVSVSGKVEKAYPIGKTVLAQSKAQATALYLMHINANMVSREISVIVDDILRSTSDGSQVSDVLREVSCKQMN